MRETEIDPPLVILARVKPGLCTGCGDEEPRCVKSYPGGFRELWTGKVVLEAGISGGPNTRNRIVTGQAASMVIVTASLCPEDAIAFRYVDDTHDEAS